MAKLSLDSLCKTYPNGVQAVHPASFDIRDGEFVVLVGPSGCGKSTLLRMMAGLESVTDGTLVLGDRVLNDIDPAERNIAMVFQNYALYPHMTVARNMSYGLKNRGLPRAEIDAKVREAAALLNLTEYLDRRPAQLSGGQRQRVAMGRAIVREPDLFLFDEPLSNLDAKLRNQMRIEIRALQRRVGTTAVYVTHDQVEAMTMADRIVVLNAGRIEQIGTPADIYSKPATLFVAGFIGAPPMNLLEARAGAGLAFSDGTPLPVQPAPAVDGDLVVGIRPEDVEVGSGPLTFSVTLAEELGAQRLLHGSLAGQAFTASVAKDHPAREGDLSLAIKAEALHLYSKESGMRL